MAEYIMTQECFDDLSERLRILKTEKRQEISKAIEEARSLGDLSENAEYHAAKDAQGQMEGEILEIEEKLRNAKIIEEVKDASIVSIGSYVKILNHHSNTQMEYRIVGAAEANPFEKKISNESPVGSALLGHKVGEVVDVVAPGGVIKVEILEININKN